MTRRAQGKTGNGRGGTALCGRPAALHGGWFAFRANVGYSLSQGIIATAAKAGESAFAGSNLIWWLVLARGAVTKWKFALPIARRWIMISLSVVLGAIGIPGWSGTQG